MQKPITSYTQGRYRHACTLQEEDWDADAPCIVATEILRGGQQMLELASYHIRDAGDPDPDETPELADVILLPRKAWETLVELFAVRYPEAAARLVQKAHGWNCTIPAATAGHAE